MSDWNKLYNEWQEKLHTLQEEGCPHTDVGDWTHVHEGYDARYCLNCCKEIEIRDGQFVIVRRMTNGYLFYANGKWSKTVKKATIFVNDSGNEVYREAYQKYANGDLMKVRMMPRMAFGKT